MSGRRILIPAVTVAEWGGLHEWVAECTQWLVEAGHQVTVIGNGVRFSAAIEGAGARFFKISNWTDWPIDFAAALDLAVQNRFDLLFSHGPQARALGMAISRELGVPLYVMIHGAYHDYAFEWLQQARRFIVASPSLEDYIADVAKVPRSLIKVVPNGLPADIGSLVPQSLESKIAGGVGRIMTASRLDHDKVRQIPVALNVIKTCAEVRPDIFWQLDVYGDGSRRPHFEREWRRGLSTISNADLKLHGWVPPEEIPIRVSESVVGIVAGLGGMRSVATGTLCVAVGARDNLGVQYGQNLRAGLYSNFGDHGAQGYRPSEINQDVRRIIGNASEYDRITTEVRNEVIRLRSRDVVRRLLLDALDLA